MTKTTQMLVRTVERAIAGTFALILAFSPIFTPATAYGAGLADFLGVSYTAGSVLTRGISTSDEVREPRATKWIVASAYTSEPRQTDGTPYVTANGSFVYDGLIAANGLPFGTLVTLDAFPGKIFRVDDRMNARYGADRIDIWMTDIKDARQFGMKRMKMEIIGRQHAMAKR